MPAIPPIFNKFLCLLLLQTALLQPLMADIPMLSEPDLKWLGQQVFTNECAASFNCLTSWNEGEDFPSLGIGHFIWYRSGQTEVFEESFPDLIAFYRAQAQPLPQWLEQSTEVDSPWQTREQFFDEFQSQRMTELRQFLADSADVQVNFIVHRLERSLPSLFDSLEKAQAMESRFDTLAQQYPPYGIYALIDYVHFKGTGTAVSERYLGQGWGLVQVLQEMGDKEPTLQQFVNSAATVLEQRVRNAPAERREQRWLAGWKNRLSSYLPP